MKTGKMILEEVNRILNNMNDDEFEKLHKEVIAKYSPFFDTVENQGQKEEFVWGNEAIVTFDNCPEILTGKNPNITYLKVEEYTTYSQKEVDPLFNLTVNSEIKLVNDEKVAEDYSYAVAA
jgi:hypothetical protein